MVCNKQELNEEILKVLTQIKRQVFIEHYLEISDWFAELIVYPTQKKFVSDFFLRLIGT
jgi:hypothetical protein